jgi:DNA-binding protein H-NS
MDYLELPYDELKSLHKEIGSLLAEKKQEALARMREQMIALGFTVADLTPPKQKGNGTKKYVNPDNTEDIYRGKGPKPQWLKDALDAGKELDDFRA